MGTVIRSKMEGLYPDGLDREQYSIAFGRIANSYPWMWDLYEYVDNSVSLTSKARNINDFIHVFLNELDKLPDHEVRMRTKFDTQLQALIFKTNNENIDTLENIQSGEL